MPDPDDRIRASNGRRILLAVTGLTPQVVTETLYALHRADADTLPHQVHVLTTAEGAERARLALLSEEPGWFARLCADFGLPPIAFDESHIHVLRSADGQPLADIRSASDNAAAADQIADFIRRLTADPDTALHVSLAGGRKTLGFFAGYALSLWGRPQDRLSHVLVSEPFESSWEFFYPTPYERIIQTRDGKIANCAKAEVSLADIPFVRLRHGLPAELREGRASFAQAVAAAQGQLGPPRLVLDLRHQRADAAGRAFELPPADLAFLAWFARRAQRGLPGVPCPNEGAPSAEHAQAYLAEYRRIRGFLDDDAATVRRYAAGMAKADFEERKSKLKRALQRALGAAAVPYTIVGEGRRPMRYRLALPADAIRVAD
ncbi:MAG: TIGR02584 family CRISPR-associated protein [Burkholderiales bacterium]|nr:TIGR02584 family CRISPR-associated protein [Burkholderiales bacterium]